MTPRALASNHQNYPKFALALSSVTFGVTAGTTYRIAVDGYKNSTGTINLNLAMRPANDKFADAQALSGTTATADGSNVNATGEVGEINHADVSGTLASIWYTWTAPASGNVTINTFNSSFDTTLAVYTGNAVDALTLVDPRRDFGYNDDAFDNGVYVPQSSVTFGVTAGTTYRIAVAGYRGATGIIRLDLRMS